jgi:hypothetical protein
VRAAALLAFGEVAARCPACMSDPALRERWGCDKDADMAIYAIECPRCDSGDPDCELCGGGGSYHVARCPSSQVDRSAVKIVEAYRWAREGVLPDPGGLYQQPAELVRAFGLLDRERSRIELDRERRSRDAAKRRK